MFKRPLPQKQACYGWKAKAPKFSPEQCQEIREAHSKGVAIRELGRLYHADKNTILAVVNRRGAYSKYKQV